MGQTDSGAELDDMVLHDEHEGMVWMMGGGAVVGILVVVLLLVSIAVGVKYLRSGRHQPPRV